KWRFTSTTRFLTRGGSTRTGILLQSTPLFSALCAVLWWGALLHSWRLLPGLVRISPVAREGGVRPPNPALGGQFELHSPIPCLPASLRPGQRPDRFYSN